MIEKVEQTSFQREEAATPGSLARSMLLQLIRRQRRAWGDWLTEQKRHPGTCDTSFQVQIAFERWLVARACTETVRRILYGWEQ
jgi:hypothetical protein